MQPSSWGQITEEEQMPIVPIGDGWKGDGLLQNEATFVPREQHCTGVDNQMASKGLLIWRVAFVTASRPMEALPNVQP